MADFDPGAPAESGSGIFGLPFNEKEAALVLIPVPWEATTSYGGGTSKAPAAILKASKQVDLFDGDVLRPYEPGLFLRKEHARVRAWNKAAKAAAQKVLRALDAGRPAPASALDKVNELGGRLNGFVYAQIKSVLAAGKIPAVVGGDHSTPYGAIQAAAEAFPGLGLLHFDAHHDTREAYEGFTWSHASIFFNVLGGIPAVSKLVQVGIRDFSEAEAEFCRSQGERVRVFYDRELSRRRFAGEPFDAVCAEIVEALPREVWVTFDIDGLDPRFCPGTGTPVPGGLDFAEANHILGAVARSGRRIVGFDLNEVAPSPKSEWDANVGARLLYKLSAWTLASQGKARLRA
jgi:agmatinase